MSADTGSAGNPPNTRKPLASGSNASHKHLKTLSNQFQAYTAAHPDCRAIVCLQSGYDARKIPLMLLHNLGIQHAQSWCRTSSFSGAPS
jgi:hypothetical protein